MLDAGFIKAEHLLPIIIPYYNMDIDIPACQPGVIGRGGFLGVTEDSVCSGPEEWSNFPGCLSRVFCSPVYHRPVG